MKKKRVVTLLVTLLAAGCLCGCAKGEEAASDTQAVDAKQETAEAKTDTQKRDANTIVVWGDENEDAFYKEAVKLYNKKENASIKLDVKTMSSSEIRDNTMADVMNAPDVFSLPDDQLSIFVAGGVLEPIENSEEIKKVTSDDAVAAATMDDKMYAYPSTTDNGYFLFYNKKYLNEKDVASMDGILKVAAAKKKKLLMDWSSGWYTCAFFQAGGMKNEIGEDGLTTVIDWNSTETKIKGVDIAEAMLKIASNKGFLASGENEKNMKNGTAIAIVSGMWDLPNAQKYFGEDYGACKLPTFTVKGKQVQMSSVTGYRMIGVNSYSPNKELATKFAQFVTSEEGQKLRVTVLGRGPANKNVAEMEEVKQSAAIQAVMDQAPYGKIQKVGATFWTPASELGMTLANGNPDKKPLQELLDAAVLEITGQ